MQKQEKELDRRWHLVLNLEHARSVQSQCGFSLQKGFCLCTKFKLSIDVVTHFITYRNQLEKGNVCLRNVSISLENLEILCHLSLIFMTVFHY